MKRYSLKSENSLCLLISFLIPFTVLLCLFAVEGLAPFGDKSLCSMDGYSQYYPMLMNMGESLKEGEIFYSFSGALGFNLWAQSAYYTASPLWLIVYLLPYSMKLVGLHFLIMLKLCLASVFFCLYLLKTQPYNKSSGYIYPVVSAAWGLSGYMIAFVNQFMWTDVIMLLPLVVLGIDLIVQKKSRLLYIFSLALSIWCCFYLGYMVCIFAVLYFGFALFKKKRDKKESLRTCLSFGISSLIAGGLCGVSLIPVAKALSLTAAAEIPFGGTVELRYTLWEFIQQLLPCCKISLEYGAPNLYCSLTAVIAMVFSFFSKDKSKRERILSFALVTFMSLTMCINIGEFVWHGFHYPNQLPARQSFLLIFLILTFGARGLSAKKLNSYIKGTAIALIITGVITTASLQFLTQTWTSQTSASLRLNDSKMEYLAAKSDGDIFSRTETLMKKNNYPQQYHYNGVAYYSSTMTADAWEFFQALGMERFAQNVSTYYTDSYIVSRLFGIKYTLDKEGTLILTNDDALSLAYLSDKAVVSLNLADYEKGEAAQEALLDAISLGENERQKDAIAHLKRNELKITSFDTDVIRGEISCEREGVLLTTLPYDGGWKIFIDGKAVDTVKAAGYLTACDITEGIHTVKMRYTVPGIVLGAVISGISLVALGVLIWFEHEKKKQTV